jgi:hypothetical protein
MAAEPRPNPYGDSPAPRVFQTVSPLDPQLSSRIVDHADELLTGENSGKYSPVEVAQWLEDLSSGVTAELTAAGGGRQPETRRLVVDARIQAGLGLFFAAKLRAGVLLAIHQRTRNGRALQESLAMYRRARQAWAELSAVADPVYAADLSVSDKISERGRWSDRLAAIDADIARIAQLDVINDVDARAEAAVRAALSHPQRAAAPCRHNAPASFTPGTALRLTLTLIRSDGITGATCCYRHVNQAERYQTATMTKSGSAFHVELPASYTDSAYPLQYYFVVHAGRLSHLYPGLGPDRMQMPYFVVRS